MQWLYGLASHHHFEDALMKDIDMRCCLGGATQLFFFMLWALQNSLK
jgi:hypothetical protein